MAVALWITVLCGVNTGLPRLGVPLYPSVGEQDGFNYPRARVQALMYGSGAIIVIRVLCVLTSSSSSGGNCSLTC